MAETFGMILTRENNRIINESEEASEIVPEVSFFIAQAESHRNAVEENAADGREICGMRCWNLPDRWCGFRA